MSLCLGVLRRLRWNESAFLYLEGHVNWFRAMIVFMAALILSITASAQGKAPLQLSHSTPLPELHDGDFDHFAVDVEGKRLFSAAEENSKVLVFDLRTNKLISTINDLKAPHSMVYRADLKKLFVADGDLGEVKIYNTDNYVPAGSIKVREGADSSAFDPTTKYMYVVNGGKDAKLPNAYITVIDTSTGKTVKDIKMDSDDVEAMTFDNSGLRLFADVRGNHSVEVLDREKGVVIAKWPLTPAGAKPVTIAFDRANHRLFVGTREPGQLLVLDSNSGKIITSLPAAAMVDDMAFDSHRKRIYFAGTQFIDVFAQKDAHHYEQVGHIPTSFRAKTAILVPELNRLYLAVPHHEKQAAELRVYDLAPREK